MNEVFHTVAGAPFRCWACVASIWKRLSHRIHICWVECWRNPRQCVRISTSSWGQREGDLVTSVNRLGGGQTRLVSFCIAHRGHRYRSWISKMSSRTAWQVNCCYDPVLGYIKQIFSWCGQLFMLNNVCNKLWKWSLQIQWCCPFIFKQVKSKWPPLHECWAQKRFSSGLRNK